MPKIPKEPLLPAERHHELTPQPVRNGPGLRGQPLDKLPPDDRDPKEDPKFRSKQE